MCSLVTIVIPTYNRAHYLPEAVESALRQTYPHIEIIVVNDGSQDNTEEALAPYMPHIRYIKQANQGCSAAKNTGLAAARGELITNLDDDDRIHPEKIEHQVDRFRQNPHLGLCGTGVNYIDAEGEVTNQYMPPQFRRETQVLQLLRKCYLVQSSVLIRRECHEKLGDYSPRFSEDYDFWLRVAPHYDIDIVKKYLTDYRVHGNQMTGPATHARLMQDVRFHVREFVERTPVEQIIPGICSYPEAYALLGLIIGEQEVYPLAENYLGRALPHPAAHLAQGLLHLQRFDYEQAIASFDLAYATEPLLVEKVDQATRLLKQTQTTLAIPGVHNKSPEVVALRKALSQYRSGIIKELYYAARGEYDFARSHK